MRVPMGRRVRQRLSTQVVLMMVAILVVTMVAGFFVVQLNLRQQFADQYERRAMSVAQTLAVDPSVTRLVAEGHPGGPLQRLATEVEHQTGALFVVIVSHQGIRLTHPNPALIGTPIDYRDPEPESSEPFRTGVAWMGIQHGTLALEAVGKVPVWGGGKLIGEVSVGFKDSAVSQRLAAALPSLAVYLLVVLAVGVLAALALARRLKRQTFGLELSEIAALLQEREAMLHGIKEGVLGYDKAGRVLLANDPAKALLGLPPNFLGRPIREMLPPGRIADVVTGEATGSDLLVLCEDRVLVANRMPIKRNNRQHVGWVVTFQDRTESESLKRELEEAIGLTETLRAQSHEFANQLHTLVGLVELGHTREAIQFVTDVSASRTELTDQLVDAIGEPKLAALILAKVSLADERNVRLRVMPDTRVGRLVSANGQVQRISDITGVLTVVGNLIDNAIDAAAHGSGAREVELTLVAAESDLLVRVRDSGPGVPHDMREQIFMDGVTTKSSATGARRGLGLALVRQIVEGRGGMISVGQDGGAVFTAVLPGCLATETDETGETGETGETDETGGEPATADPAIPRPRGLS
jgi:two-component system, CitB family, sensor kinase